MLKNKRNKVQRYQSIFDKRIVKESSIYKNRREKFEGVQISLVSKDRSSSRSREKPLQSSSHGGSYYYSQQNSQGPSSQSQQGQSYGYQKKQNFERQTGQISKDSQSSHNFGGGYGQGFSTGRGAEDPGRGAEHSQASMRGASKTMISPEKPKMEEEYALPKIEELQEEHEAEAGQVFEEDDGQRTLEALISVSTKVVKMETGDGGPRHSEATQAQLH